VIIPLATGPVKYQGIVVSWYQEVAMQENDGRRPGQFQIQIDRVHYTVQHEKLTGAELRQVPNPTIGPDRDLWEVVPGGQDRKIEDTDAVEIRNGKRFFTAPAQINPGHN
jgi:hypothetical protein